MNHEKLRDILKGIGSLPQQRPETRFRIEAGAETVVFEKSQHDSSEQGLYLLSLIEVLNNPTR